ncbi:MAG: ATP-binding protein [Vulcanimicrobiaceae bacterium]
MFDLELFDSIDVDGGLAAWITQNIYSQDTLDAEEVQVPAKEQSEPVSHNLTRRISVSEIPDDESLTVRDENPVMRRLYEKRDHCVHLPSQAPDASNIFGQDEALMALEDALAQPSVSAILLVGPAGCGKTSLAKVAAALSTRQHAQRFTDDAPFVEIDGTALMHDAKNNISPLRTWLNNSVYGHVIDNNEKFKRHPSTPMFQLGAMASAHGGILFIDEIGFLTEILQGSLLKVLEDGYEKLDVTGNTAWVDHPNTPIEMREFAKLGRVPASFLLIGATTSEPSELNQALVTRCTVIKVKALELQDRIKIAQRVFETHNIVVSEEFLHIIATANTNGRMIVQACRMICRKVSSANRAIVINSDMQALRSGASGRMGFR